MRACTTANDQRQTRHSYKQLSFQSPWCNNLHHYNQFNYQALPVIPTITYLITPTLSGKSTIKIPQNLSHHINPGNFSCHLNLIIYHVTQFTTRLLNIKNLLISFKITTNLLFCLGFVIVYCPKLRHDHSPEITGKL